MRLHQLRREHRADAFEKPQHLLLFIGDVASLERVPREQMPKRPFMLFKIRIDLRQREMQFLLIGAGERRHVERQVLHRRHVAVAGNDRPHIEQGAVVTRGLRGEIDSLFIGNLRLPEVAQRVQGDTQIVVRLGVIRLEGDGTFITRHRARQTGRRPPLHCPGCCVPRRNPASRRWHVHNALSPASSSPRSCRALPRLLCASA